jgi:predicted DsbA family dithiol-disulfide isomerase
LRDRSLACRSSGQKSSRLAQELGKWADTQPGGAALHDKIYQAYFVEARNIGDPDLLVELAQTVGLPAEEARGVLTERRFKDAVDADWAKSHQYGVTGEQLLDRSGARRRV